MNLSGILVISRPDRLEATVRNLKALPGVEVHLTDPSTGRIVLVQEAEDVCAEVDGLKAIQSLPNIVLAEMVYHYFEDDTRPLDEIPQELNQAQEGKDAYTPSWLNR